MRALFFLVLFLVRGLSACAMCDDTAGDLLEGEMTIADVFADVSETPGMVLHHAEHPELIGASFDALDALGEAVPVMYGSQGGVSLPFVALVEPESSIAERVSVGILWHNLTTGEILDISFSTRLRPAVPSEYGGYRYYWRFVGFDPKELKELQTVQVELTVTLDDEAGVHLEDSCTVLVQWVDPPNSGD
jgi:hypothetical protein